MFRSSVALTLVACWFPCWFAAQGAETKTIKLRAITLQIPTDWVQERTTSQTRLAQFRIPKSDDAPEEGEMVVYYFGGPTGGIRANISRWIGQFHETGRAVRLATGECADGVFYLSEVTGVWKKPDGPPFAQKTIDKPGSRVLGLILVTKKGDDYYFLKCSGPDALIKRHTPAFLAAIQAKESSEKPFQLEDLPN